MIFSSRHSITAYSMVPAYLLQNVHVLSPPSKCSGRAWCKINEKLFCSLTRGQPTRTIVCQMLANQSRLTWENLSSSIDEPTGFCLWTFTFFPKYKFFIRYIRDALIIESEEKFWHRDRFFALQSFVDQFNAPRFKNVIRYAFYKAGYVNESPGQCVDDSE